MSRQPSHAAKSSGAKSSPLAVAYFAGAFLGVVSLVEVANAVSDPGYERLWGSEGRWIYATKMRYAVYNAQAALVGLLPALLLLHAGLRRWLPRFRVALGYSLILLSSQAPACL